MGSEVASLIERAAADDRRALGRLLTIAERGGPASEDLEARLHARAQSVRTEPSHVVGITGAPGSGKSTLVGGLLQQSASGGRRVAVLAVDPSSPLSGGALLGDRIRMHDGAAPSTPRRDRAGDSRAATTRGTAFVRSMATRGQGGGLALAVPAALRVFEAFGYSPILVETAGVGQVELDVTRTADTTIVVLAPGMGDAVQANKAGLLEIADVLVVNKSDLPRAADVRRDLERMLDLGRLTATARLRDRPPEIVMTAATSGEGVDDLCRAIRDDRVRLIETGRLATRREARIRHEIADRVTRSLNDAASAALAAAPKCLSEALSGRTPPARAAAEVVALVLKDGRPRPL